ncbi:MAG: PP2C family protein-serine/threonine phosphatase [Pseudomonadota bacterium]
MADSSIKALPNCDRRTAELEQEMEIARAVQRSLVPPACPMSMNGVAVAAYYEPAGYCGGDFWTLRALDDNRMMIVVGDVVGHGFPSALITAFAMGCCEGTQPGSRPEAVLRLLNDAMLRAGKGSFLLSCFVTIIDSCQRTVHYANAGHTLPFVAHCEQPDGKWVLSSLSARGSLLGKDENPAFDPRSSLFRAGDVVCWFSDGLTELRRADGEAWGEKRLRNALLASLQQRRTDGESDGAGRVSSVLDQVLAARREFGSAERTDDVTLIVAELR